MTHAENLFGRRGYDAVTVSDIAAASGVSNGLVYYHFTDKESLLGALIEQAVNATKALAVEHLDPSGDPRTRITGFIHAYLRLIEERQELIRLLVRQVTDIGSPTGRPVLEHVSETIERLAGVIDEGIREGTFREVPSRGAAESLFGMLHIRVVAGVLEAPHSPALVAGPEETAEFISRLFLEGVDA